MPKYRLGRPPIAVFAPSVVLMLNGAVLIVAAIVTLVIGHTQLSKTLGLLQAAVGVASVWAALRLYDGRHYGWVAALILVPIGMTASILDTYLLGNGRFPATRVVIDAIGWTCLFLPPSRAYTARRTPQRNRVDEAD